ncbi:hypothetical protein [Otariodibacter sp.]|uniref:hypothetical protein n=1 Tax=Otariodibacter sp. TaxID=3030919 RepID=UPI002633A5CC|nr:hypothetical protein [Otariodibacter sp.]
MNQGKCFSLREFYEGLNFNELEEFHKLWRFFSKEQPTAWFEQFSLSQQEKYNQILDILRVKLSDNSTLYSQILLEYYNHNYGKNYSNLDDVKSDYSDIYKCLNASTGLFSDGYSECNYIESSLILLLFKCLDDFQKVKNKFNLKFEDNLLIDFYKDKGIDLIKEDKQYKKYGLLSISLENFDFCSHQPFQLRDRRLDSTLYFSSLIPNKTSMNKNNHISLKVYLWNSLVNRKINQLALLPEFDWVPSDGRTLLLENFERGSSFEINGLNKENIAKLFQEREYGNQLWAYIDGEENITFEEFNESATQDYLDICDFYVTNVIHLKYSKDGDNYFINHLDHEYIFYQPDEYEKRKFNHRQKGSAKKRIKTFKIDNSKIPLNTEEGLKFLETILKECLQYTELIEEFLS